MYARFWWEDLGKGIPERPRRSWVGNIKMGLKIRVVGRCGYKTKYMRHSRVQTEVKNKEIEIEGMKIEEVNSAKYLGTTMNADNLIEEEINERIAAGNRPFFANKKIFQSKIITRKTKERLYHTVIRMLGINRKH